MPISDAPYENIHQSQYGMLFQSSALSVLPHIDDNSVNLILTDPPFKISRKNNFHTMGRRGIKFDWDAGFDPFTWLSHVSRVLVPGGSLVLWNDWKMLGPLSFELMNDDMEVKRPILWYKMNPMPRNITRVPVQRCEFGLWAVKKKPKSAKWIFNKRPENPYEDLVFRYSIQFGENKAKKPVGLFAELIQLFSNPGDLVLDAFSGEGTTALAAIPLERRYICIDNCPRMFSLASASIQALEDSK